MKARVPRPSPAMVVACVALFVALGGVSYGVATGSIDGREIRDGSVASRDVRNNSLTGSDVNEARLAQVPSAATAARADTAARAATAERATAAGTADRATTAGSAAPSGPAAGGLTGSFPAPAIAPNAVGGAQVAPNALTGDDVAEDTLGPVPDAQRLNGLPASSFLRGEVYRREGPVPVAGTARGDGTFVLAQACLPGDVLLSGGPANLNATSDLIESFPSPGELESWSARIDANGVADPFSVVVHCLER